MKDFKLTITDRDIEFGLRKNESFCPVALAMKRFLYERRRLQYKTIFVNNFNIEIHNEQYPKVTKSIFYLTLEGEKFVENFDNNKPVKPCTLLIRSKPSCARRSSLKGE